MTMRNRNGQEGVAMITIMMVVVVLTLLMVATLNYAMQGEPQSRRDQDWNAALAAAQVGVDDYQYRLQQYDEYVQYSATNPPTRRMWPSPAGWTPPARPTTATSRCSEYWWQGRSTSYCVRISFVTGDTINGPLHTNDTISVNGNPRFNGKATTAYTGQMSCSAVTGFTWRWYGLSGCSDRPVFQSGDPEVVPILPLPTTNTAIKAETDRSAGKTGCLYNGPTRIVLNANGTMTVTSPFTTSSAYAACVGTNVALPANGVVYVQNVPSSQSASCSGSQNRLGYPIANDVTSYGCRDGDAFVSGTLKGRLTIAAENNIIIVANTTYATTGAASTDMLGLVANQFVKIYHPVNSSGNNLSDSRNPTNTFTNPQIHAAVLALGHSFIVQNYDEGTQLGTISLTGVIAQKWRGSVGTSGGTGYLKGYGYDSRMQSASPPYVQEITETDYRTSQWAEVTNPSGLPA
jgi:hypothetical protein